MVTIGVAVAVPEPYGPELRRHRAEFGDVNADTVPSHVTLLPPTEMTHEDIDRARELLAGVAGRHGPFTMRLRGTGTFRPVSPVVFMAVVEGISETELLAADIRSRLEMDDLRFPYHPHVTVAHDVDDVALDRAFETLRDYECAFEVGSFAVYEHDPVAGWRPTQIYDLTGDSLGGDS